MAINGNQWQSMAINGTQWHSMAINGNQWQSMAHLEGGRLLRNSTLRRRLPIRVHGRHRQARLLSSLRQAPLELARL